MSDNKRSALPTEVRPFLGGELTEPERALRDLFVNEYLKDFDPFQACLRVGFLHNYAMDWCKKFMQDSYVQSKIAELTRKAPQDKEAQEIEDRAMLENTLRQAMQNGPYAGRIAAARAFAEMRGWTKPESNHEQDLIDILKEMATKVPV